MTGDTMGEDFIAQLGPDGLQQLMALAGLGDQQQMLQGQLQQAQALRQPGPERHGARGAMFQALADGLNAYRGYRDENTVRGQVQGVLGQRDAARQKLGSAYAKAQQPAPFEPYAGALPQEQLDGEQPAAQAWRPPMLAKAPFSF